MPETSTNAQTPKSVRQKRILSIAAEQPDASIAQIADEVATATKDVVENVLEEYGDPAEQPTASSTIGGETASSDGGQPAPETGQSSIDDTAGKQPASPQPDSPAQETSDQGTSDQDADPEPTSAADAIDPAAAVAELTPKQRETLAAIRANPDATQRELADILEVSAPTVSNRVNEIPGFVWSDRCSFIESLLEAADVETVEELKVSPAASDGGTESPAADAEADANDTTASTADDAADNAAEETVAESGSSSGADESAAEEASDNSDESAASGTESADTAAIRPTDVEALIESVEALTARLAAEDSASPASDSHSDRPFAETELLHKVIHACMEAETISEEEELQILKRLT